jgi:hypothetical protein
MYMFLFGLAVQMNFWFPDHGIDLNNPVQEEDHYQHHSEAPTDRVEVRDSYRHKEGPIFKQESRFDPIHSWGPKNTMDM